MDHWGGRHTMTHACDHVVTLLDDGTLLRRRVPGSQTLSAPEEAGLLDAVRDRLPLPVPRVLHVVDDDTLVMRRLAGEPLLHRLSELGESERQVVAWQLGRFVAAAAAVPVAEVGHLLRAPADEDEHRGRASHLRSHLGNVPASRRAAVSRFLDRVASPAPPRRFLTHRALGAEHVLVRSGRAVVCGVIDFSHAGLADPARDLGLLLRDLGTTAGGWGYSAFLAAGGGAEGTLTRALFHARVSALEQLAFGVEHSSERYRAHAVRAVDELFADVA